MNKYILDTQTVEWLNDPNHIHHASCIRLSAQETRERLSGLIDFVGSSFKTVNLSHSGAKIFASLKTKYRKQSSITNRNLVRHNFDLLIASQAIETLAVLVTHDEFLKKLPVLDSRLLVLDWTEQTVEPSATSAPQ